MILISAFLKIPWVLLYFKMHCACPWSYISMAKRWDCWKILESENCAVPLTIHYVHETDSLLAQSFTPSVTFWAAQKPCFPHTVPHDVVLVIPCWNVVPPPALWILTFFPAFLSNKFVWFPEGFGVDLYIAQFRRCFVRLYNDGGVFQILLRAYWEQSLLNRFPAICVKDCHYHWLFWTFSIGDSKE